MSFRFKVNRVGEFYEFYEVFDWRFKETLFVSTNVFKCLRVALKLQLGLTYEEDNVRIPARIGDE